MFIWRADRFISFAKVFYLSVRWTRSFCTVLSIKTTASYTDSKEAIYKVSIMIDSARVYWRSANTPVENEFIAGLLLYHTSMTSIGFCCAWGFGHSYRRQWIPSVTNNDWLLECNLHTTYLHQSINHRTIG